MTSLVLAKTRVTNLGCRVSTRQTVVAGVILQDITLETPTERKRENGNSKKTRKQD